MRIVHGFHGFFFMLFMFFMVRKNFSVPSWLLCELCGEEVRLKTTG